jgi:cytoskeleton protein RodZ
VLQRLPQTASPRLVQEGEGINAPFRSPADGPGPSVLDQVSRPVVLTVVALLLGALVLVFLPISQKSQEPTAQAQPEPPQASPAAAAPAAPAPTAATPAAPATPPAPAPVAAAPAAPVAPAIAPAPAPAAVAVPAAPAATPATVVAAPQAAASGPINARGLVLFRTRGQSWIQVTDAHGTTVFQRLMEPGESAGASGTPPLSVVIGNVDATEVQMRGRPFNLAPITRDNVARFEVK